MKVYKALKKMLLSGAAGLFLAATKAFLLHPVQHIEAWCDYRRTYKEASFLRKRKYDVAHDKVVLIVSMTDQIYLMKLQSMLAVGLKLIGWKTLILTSRRYAWSTFYFKCFGFREFIYIEDITLTAKEERRCVEDVANFIKEPLTFSSVKAWRYRGAWIGPQILSSVGRSNHLAALDMTDPTITRQIVSRLSGALQRVYQSETLLALYKPSMILFQDPNGCEMAPLADISVNAKSNVIFHYQFKDDALGFKRMTSETRRLHPLSMSLMQLRSLCAVEWNQQENELSRIFEDLYGGRYFLLRLNQPNVKKKTSNEIINELGLDPKKKIAVVFSHLLWDANLFYGDDLFEDYGEWFVETVRAASRNHQVNWIIKLHPANLWKRARDEEYGELAELKLLKKHIGNVPENITLLYPDTDISTLSLFQSIDYGITVRGTVGIELPCFGVTTLTAGTGRYSGLGFTIDSSDREEYLDNLNNIQSIPEITPEQVQRAKWHAYGLLKLRAWEMKSFRSRFNFQESGSHPLDFNLSILASSYEDIEQNNDLQEWAQWAESTSQSDYVRPTI